MALAHFPSSPEKNRRRGSRTRAEDVFIQTPEKNSFLEDELTEVRIRKMVQKLEEYYSNSCSIGPKKFWAPAAVDTTRSFCDLAAPLSTILPEKRIPSHVFTEEMYQKIVELFEVERLVRFFDSNEIRVVSRFFPHHLNEFLAKGVRYGFSKFSFGALKKEMSKKRKNKQYTGLYDSAFQAALIDPERKKELILDEEVYGGVTGELYELYQSFHGTRDPKKSPPELSYVYSAARVAALTYPSHQDAFREKAAVFSHPFLQTLEDTDQWIYFAQMIEELKILFSDHVEFPAPGMLKIVEDSSQIREASPLPIRSEY